MKNNRAPRKAKRENRHTISHGNGRFTIVIFSYPFLRLPFKELALQVSEFSNLHPYSFAHDQILVQVCAFTLAFFFYTSSKVFYISRQCEVGPVEVSNVMHSNHILASRISAVALHRFTWLKIFVLLQASSQANNFPRHCRQ